MEIFNLSKTEKNIFDKIFNKKNISDISISYRKFEDFLMNKNKFRVAIISKNDLNFLKHVSIPFILEEDDPIKNMSIYINILELIWNFKLDCNICSDHLIIKRHVVPTGNLNPMFIVIGEAPGKSDGEKEHERTMGRGPTSTFLKNSLEIAGILKYCWFTNLAKCSLRENKLKDISVFENCFEGVINEIKILDSETLRVQKIFLLGKSVSNFIENKINLYNKSIEVLRVVHPSSCLYKNINEVEYAKNFNI